MQIEDFIRRIKKNEVKNKDFSYKFGKELSTNDFLIIENKLDINIPTKIKEFYLAANGIHTRNPNFEIIEIDLWILYSKYIHFATFDNSAKIYFDTSNLNAANEWSILNIKTDYKITLSISSFWSNKIWHWLEHKRKIWEDDWEDQLHLNDGS